MKTIGLIGGMSWESSAEYYRMINEAVRRRMGGLHSAKCILSSLDFAEVERCQSSGDWDAAAAILRDAACGLEAAGADFILIGANTMHKVIEPVQAGIHIPILHIADLTAAAVLAQGIQTVGLLGTKYTMEEDFYTGRLVAQGIRVLVPEAADRALVNAVIYDELCVGQVLDASRAEFKRIMAGLVERGAQGIILGCTELDLLVSPEDSPVPLFDTTLIHAEGAVETALA